MDKLYWIEKRREYHFHEGWDTIEFYINEYIPIDIKDKAKNNNSNLYEQNTQQNDEQNNTHDDDVNTSYDGTFEFKYLNKGNYEIFVYSDCVDCPKGQDSYLYCNFCQLAVENPICRFSLFPFL
ncbi:hypothetical protein N9K77_00690 [bacterium]|nr:hypothetical protein [bacterium]